MTKPVIVVAEDDAAIRTLLVIELESRGYAVIEAANGNEARDVIFSERPDAVIMDLMMPGMDGNAVLALIREDDEIHDTLVMMVTARSDSDAINESFAYGADDYITKPFHADEIDRALRQLLDGRR